ncbi:hypothetical protein, partial [Paucihalobacter sp.]|uniref:hypothetical protein n=1 Tax=Paucihalobacter sp. TaxID=2850405 RepID=UPI003D16155A
MKAQFTSLLFLLLIMACSPQRWQVKHIKWETHKIESQAEDSATLRSILPYRMVLDSQMNRVIGINKTKLIKSKPEGNLGSWMADAMR